MGGLEEVLLDVENLMGLLVVAEKFKFAIGREQAFERVLYGDQVFLELENELVLVAARVTLQRHDTDDIFDGVFHVLQVYALLHDVQNGIDRLIGPEETLVGIRVACDSWLGHLARRVIAVLELIDDLDKVGVVTGSRNIRAIFIIDATRVLNVGFVEVCSEPLGEIGLLLCLEAL
eukprot:CAMPEP_0185568740 /NCGR_PEP_ID=MMETSP0434-20130131/1602_1 /TAXON_ID=626734 ORGANISM="Favella taraikaensis, Strain Fe Narragansett Bay" /NCGR_SAMPLE_ID=MMETSP0434 /ASSEMBLY_ACC=CAM_ASM_000379 /LENGTH=175 /DNA_ID=CAMNT_0028183341 /DNA_START=913 /DNA_END=1440 /DNA_ORIENTATION=-